MNRVATASVKISARVPEDLLKNLERFYPHQEVSSLLRALIEKEVQRRKTLRAHMKLYGRFRSDVLDESLL